MSDVNSSFLFSKLYVMIILVIYMGLTIKNKNNYELRDDIASFFSLPVEEEKKEKKEALKEKIYKLKIDNEEKANIINKINLLETTKSRKERTALQKEIDSFKKKYHI